MKEKVSIDLCVFEILATTFSHIFSVMKGCETIIGNIRFWETAIDGSKSREKIQNDYIFNTRCTLEYG